MVKQYINKTRLLGTIEKRVLAFYVLKYLEEKNIFQMAIFRYAIISEFKMTKHSF